MLENVITLLVVHTFLLGLSLAAAATDREWRSNVFGPILVVAIVTALLVNTSHGLAAATLAAVVSVAFDYLPVAVFGRRLHARFSGS